MGAEDKVKKELIDQLAIKYNMDKQTIRQAVESQFEFVVEAMKKCKDVRLPYFGIFKYQPQKAKKINETRRKTELRKSEESP